MQPEEQKSKDIEKSNNLSSMLRPYLCREDEIPDFVKHRMFSILDEIKDPGLHASASAQYYFAIGDVDNGILYAEKSVSIDPKDLVSWLHYAFCILWDKAQRDLLMFLGVHGNK